MVGAPPTGAVVVQAELHGLLTKIRDLSVRLISVEVIDPPEDHRSQPELTRGTT